MDMIQEPTCLLLTYHLLDGQVTEGLDRAEVPCSYGEATPEEITGIIRLVVGQLICQHDVRHQGGVLQRTHDHSGVDDTAWLHGQPDHPVQREGAGLAILLPLIIDHHAAPLLVEQLRDSKQTIP